MTSQAAYFVPSENDVLTSQNDSYERPFFKGYAWPALDTVDQTTKPAETGLQSQLPL